MYIPVYAHVGHVSHNAFLMYDVTIGHHINEYAVQCNVLCKCPYISMSVKFAES
jgi:hypothetical protein